MSLVTDYAKYVKGTLRCVQCGEFIEDTLSSVEEKEFQLSGMCPKCFKEAMEEVPEIPTVGLTINQWGTVLNLVRKANNEPDVSFEMSEELYIISDAIIDMALKRAKRRTK